MNKGIKLSLIIMLFCTAFMAVQMTAQEKKSTKKITIIEETTNADGSTTIKTTIKEGEHADLFIKKKGDKGEKQIIKKKIMKKEDVAGDDIVVVKKGGEVKVEVKVIEEDGKKKIYIQKGDEEAEVIEIDNNHAEHKNIIIEKTEGRHNSDENVELIHKDVEKIIIRKSGDGLDEEHIEIKGIEGEKGDIFFMDDADDFEVKTLEKDGKKIIIMQNGEGEEIIWNSDHDELKWVEKEQNGPFLGVFLGNSETTEQGVRISGVVENGPAEKAGLVANDLITAINGKEIKDQDALFAVLGELEIGDEVEIGYNREGRNAQTKLKLADKADFQVENKLIEIEDEMPFMMHQEEKELKLGVYFVSGEGENGLEVEKVAEGSVAEKAGLQKGDILYDFEGEKIEDVYDVLKMLKRVDKGDTRTLKVKRDGKNIDLKAQF